MQTAGVLVWLFFFPLVLPAFAQCADENALTDLQISSAMKPVIATTSVSIPLEGLLFLEFLLLLGSLVVTFPSVIWPFYNNLQMWPLWNRAIYGASANHIAPCIPFNIHVYIKYLPCEASPLLPVATSANVILIPLVHVSPLVTPYNVSLSGGVATMAWASNATLGVFAAHIYTLSQNSQNGTDFLVHQLFCVCHILISVTNRLGKRQTGQWFMSHLPYFSPKCLGWQRKQLRVSFPFEIILLFNTST